MGSLPCHLPGLPPPHPGLSLTSQLAVPGHNLGHEAPGLVLAHHIGDLLLALLGAGPGQCGQRVLAQNLALRGEDVVRGLGGALHTPCVSMWGEASNPDQRLPGCCPTQVLAARCLGGRGGRDPPASSVPAGNCPHHFGHGHTWALGSAPPAPMPSAGTAPPPRGAVRVLGALAGVQGPWLPLSSFL